MKIERKREREKEKESGKEIVNDNKENRILASKLIWPKRQVVSLMSKLPLLPDFQLTLYLIKPTKISYSFFFISAPIPSFYLYSLSFFSL